MKSITIGRREGCNIPIDNEMVSRQHAVLRIYALGRMELVDMSKNGTFVNGVRLRQGVPFPVRRGDVVNFADVQQLDWSQVPDPREYVKWAVAVVALLVVCVAAILLMRKPDTPTADPAPTTLQTEMPETPQQGSVPSTQTPPADNSRNAVQRRDSVIKNIDRILEKDRAEKQRRIKEKERQKAKEKKEEEERERVKNTVIM